MSKVLLSVDRILHSTEEKSIEMQAEDTTRAMVVAYPEYAEMNWIYSLNLNKKPTGAEGRFQLVVVDPNGQSYKPTTGLVFMIIVLIAALFWGIFG